MTIALDLDFRLLYLDSVRVLVWSVAVALLDELRGSERVFGERVTVERREVGVGESV